MAKTGRKQKTHTNSFTGEPVTGLTRQPDGRWRIIGTQSRFTEPDERKAIARFRQWQSRQRADEALIAMPRMEPAAELDDDMSGALDAVLRHELGEGEHRAASDPSYILRIAATEPVALLRAIPEESLWQYVAEQIAERPKDIAARTGIEWIAYGPKIAKPEPSPTLAEVWELYNNKPKKLSRDWQWKSKTFWNDFSTMTGAHRLDELTHDRFLAYADEVLSEQRGAAYSKQRFGIVKTILNYPQKRNRWVAECQRVSAICRATLIPSDRSAAVPSPIERDDMHRLLSHADDQMAATLLCMLNFCMYGGEAVLLNWSDFTMAKSTLTTRRNKTGVIRIGTIWQRTADALAKLPRKADAVFLNDIGGRQDYSALWRSFAKLREAAKLTGVQMSHIRDGAYTAAIEGGASLEQANLLAGHATGIADKYVQRRPAMVSDACRAVEDGYFS